MKQGSTVFLKLVVLFMLAGVLAFCLLALPAMMREQGAQQFRIIFWGMYAMAVPILFALFQTWKILTYIDESKAFSDLSVKALSQIKFCAVTVSLIVAPGLPLLFFIAEADDAPGAAAIGLFFAFGSAAIAALAAVLQRVLQDAIRLKSENDLTV